MTAELARNPTASAATALSCNPGGNFSTGPGPEAGLLVSGIMLSFPLLPNA